MGKYLIAHEGQIDLAAIVTANNELEAAVKYYETRRACYQPGCSGWGEKGHKNFKIGDIAYNDGLCEMEERTLYHHADLDGDQWLRDVEPIDNWAKYGHYNITHH